MKQKVAICVGHSRKINRRFEGGAISLDGTKERDFNIPLAKLICENLKEKEIETLNISSYDGNGYFSAMKNLANRLKSEGVTMAIELHFNSCDKESANGHEWLYWHSSPKGKLLALSFNAQMKKSFPNMSSRGAIPVRPDGRGAAFLNLTHCPSAICEPGFGTNRRDWEALCSKKEILANSIAEAIFRTI